MTMKLFYIIKEDIRTQENVEFNTIPHKFWWVVHNSIKKEPIAGPIFITDYSTISLLKNKKSYHNLLFLFYLILKYLPEH